MRIDRPVTLGSPWRSAQAVRAIAAFAVCAACGSPDSSRSREATDDAAQSADIGPAPGDSTLPPGSAPESQPMVPLLIGEGPPRDYRLLLINASDVEARVFAQAAASRVALDTVPPHDSTRVDVRVRADEISLDAEDPTGAFLFRQTLMLSPDTLNRWVISPVPPNPAADSSPALTALSTHPANLAYYGTALRTATSSTAIRIGSRQDRRGVRVVPLPRRPGREPAGKRRGATQTPARRRNLWCGSHVG